MNTVAIIVFVLVILFAMLNARIYNFLHGFFSLFGIATFVVFIWFALNKFGVMGVNNKYFLAVSMVNSYIVEPLANIFRYFKLTFMSDLNEFTFYIITIGIWVISSVVSIMIRKIVRNRE